MNSIEDGLFVLKPNLSHYVMEHSGTSVKTVAQGTNAVFNIDLTDYSFGSTVNLSLSGVPAGASGAFAATVSPSGSVTITISNTNLAALGNYQLILTGNAGTASEESISMGLIITAMLPVELVDFSATAQRNSIHLNWETASEFQNKSFEIQRSMNNTPTQFEPIAWVDGQGNSELLQHYFHEDTDVKTGVIYYYRLRQIDVDGTEEFSKIVQAKITSFEEKVDIFPNPVTDFLMVKFDAFDFPIQNMEMSVVNVNGKVLKQEKLDIFSGEINYELNTQSLSEGIYWLRFLVDGEEFMKRFVKM